MAAQLKINGNEKTFDSDTLPATLADLLAQLKLDAATVVAEINGTIVPPNAFAQTRLADGMKLELVRFVPGG
jgi:thiamine biosynthesis protein ThiS